MPLNKRERRVLVSEKLAVRLLPLGVPEEALITHRDPLPPAKLLEHATAAVLWHPDPARLAKHLLHYKQDWEWMHSLWTGLEHLPLRELRSGVKVLTTGRGTGAIPMTEWVVLALLWHAKQLEEVSSRFRQGSWEQPILGELWGRRVVILGLGAIGRYLAQTLSKLGVEVTGVRRDGQPTRGCREVVGMGKLQEVCREAQALVIVLPSTPTTKGLVGKEVLQALPAGSLVVNIGRAAVVDEEALLAEVASGRLWAALDVWWQEPLPAASPWRQLGQLLPSCHGAYRSERFMDRHAQRVAENIKAYLAGKQLRARVSKRAWREMLEEGGAV